MRGTTSQDAAAGGFSLGEASLLHRGTPVVVVSGQPAAEGF